jgi:hypothetical protein
VYLDISIFSNRTYIYTSDEYTKKIAQQLNSAKKDISILETKLK